MKGQVSIDIKTEVWKRNRRLHQLADSMQLSRGQLYRILNGYDREPEGFKKDVYNVLREWDSESDSNT